MTAVLFDLDGVLLNSERPTKLIWNQLLPSNQNTLWEQCLGATQNLEQQIFYDILGWKANRYFQFVRQVKQRLPSAFLLRPDSIQLLKNLGDIPVALVTSRSCSELPRIMNLEDWKKLSRNIDVLVTGDMGLDSKPSPAPYLFAANQLGVSTDQCFVVEDSPNGVKSAIAAGMNVIAVEDTVKHNCGWYQKSVVLLSASLINDVERIIRC